MILAHSHPRLLAVGLVSALLAGCASGNDAVDPEVEPGFEPRRPVPGVDAGPGAEPDPGADADPTATPTFTDLAGNVFQTEIYQLAEQGRILGVTEERFEPALCVTRADFAALLAVAVPLPAGQPCSTSEYSDVAASDERCAVIAAASDAGFLSGYTDGSFRPDEPFVRYHALVALAAGAGLVPEDSAQRGNDPLVTQYLSAMWAEIPTWARYPVAAATEANLNVYDAKGLSVDAAACTRRDEAAGLLWSYLRHVGGAP